MGGILTRDLISYEEAKKMCGPDEIQRFNDGFKCLASKDGTIDKTVFHNVLDIPVQLSNRIFEVFSHNEKELGEKQFLIGMALLSHGSAEQKIKILFSIYDLHGLGILDRDTMGKFVRLLRSTLDSDQQNKDVSIILREFFENMSTDSGVVSYDSFKDFALKHINPGLIGWIFELEPKQNTFTSDIPEPIQRGCVGDLPSIWLTRQHSLAELTHFNEKEISELQAIYSNIAAHKQHVDKDMLTQLFSSALPTEMISSIFNAFDVDKDGFVDIREFVISLSSCCRGSDEEKLNFCFNTFDQDGDGYLNRSEINGMTHALWKIRNISNSFNPVEDAKEIELEDDCNSDTLVASLFHDFDSNNDQLISFDEFTTWATVNSYALDFLNKIKLFSSVHLGLRPLSCSDERDGISSLLVESKSEVMTPGQTYYVVSANWFRIWAETIGFDASSFLINTTEIGDVAEEYDDVIYRKTVRPGPIDNSDILSPDSRSQLLHNISERIDYVILKEAIWCALSKWYGGGPPIPREVVTVGSQQEIIVELFPLTFLCRVAKPFTRTFHTNISRTASLGGLVHKIASFMHINEEDVKLWDTFEENEHIQLDDLERSIEDAKLVNNQELFVETKEDDEWTGYFPANTKIDVSEEKKTKPLVERILTARKSSGLCGLNNLGNTCFMNAALQALSNTTPLTNYFLSNIHVRELNDANREEFEGKLTIQYGALIRNLWHSEDFDSFAPRAFKWTVGKYAPRFASFQQQDAQELLNFVLDGLHEGLNRIKEKPYLSYDDSNGREFAVVAAEYWANHLQREDSVIVDLFAAQLQSTITWEGCGHDSIKFDPYYVLSLPLPEQKAFFIFVTVIFDDAARYPVKYCIEIEPNYRTLNDIRKPLSKICSLPWDSFEFFDICRFNIRALSDSTPVSSVFRSSSNQLFAFQIAPNFIFKDDSKTEYESENIKRQAFPSIGDRFDVLDSYNKWYTAVVIQINEEEGKIYVHFDRWSSKFDEWVVYESPRVQPIYSCTRMFKNYCMPATVQLKKSVYFIRLLHRKLEPARNYFIQPIKPIVFAPPMLLLLERGLTTSATLYRVVWAKMKRFARIPEENLPDNMFKPSDPIKDSVFPPFVLKTVKHDGHCCSRCSWHKFCLGHQIEFSDDLIEFSDNETLSIDWNLSYFKKYVDISNMFKVFNDDTIKQYTEMNQQTVNFFDCVKCFTKTEKLEGDSAVFCSKCKNHHSAVKMLTLYSTPRIFVIHLKRLLRGVKLSTMVDFPITDFDPSSFFQSKVKSAKYDLFAVVNHIGSSLGGHYIAYCFNAASQKWYCYDDSRVRILKDSDPIVTKNAYMLFYKQQDLDDSLDFLPEEIRSQINANLSTQQQAIIDLENNLAYPQFKCCGIQ